MSNALLNANPNLNPANDGGASNAFRLDRSQAVTADQDHNYLAEQQAFDAGLMDLFPLHTGVGGTNGNLSWAITTATPLRDCGTMLNTLR